MNKWGQTTFFTCPVFYENQMPELDKRGLSPFMSCWLEVLAQSQCITALGELYVFQEGHAEQNLVSLQPGRDSRPDIL
jgi:hypothetical protein